MAILMTMEVPGGTSEMYDRTNEILGIHGDADAPEGLISHVAGVTDDGFLVVDVWDSEESLNRFFAERLGAALHEAGWPEVTPTILPVHAIIPQGAGAEANVIMIVEPMPGFGAAEYDALADKLDAHSGSGEHHPAVSHVAAVKDGELLIVDVWESPEAFGEFAQRELAGPMEGMPPIEPRFVRVHNRMRGKAAAIG